MKDKISSTAEGVCERCGHIRKLLEHHLEYKKRCLCEKCDYNWVSKVNRTEKPRKCPKCYTSKVIEHPLSTQFICKECHANIHFDKVMRGKLSLAYRQKHSY